MNSDDDFRWWSDKKLRREADQHWVMAGLARRDLDMKDAQRHTELARKYDQELSERR